MPTPKENHPEVIEVEVERLPPRDDPRTGRGQSGRMDPILGGLFLDVADSLTGLGLPPKVSLVVGAVAGYWVAGAMGLPFKKRLLIAAVGAVYCSVRGTQFLPLGTLVGLLSRFGVRGK